jgi:hypothetical protein
MKFSITAVTAHRFLAKALLRLNPHIDELKRSIQSVVLESPPADIIMMTLLDEPFGYVEVISNSDNPFQVGVGYQTDLSLRPRDAVHDDPILLNNIVQDVRFVFDKCPFEDNDRQKMLTAYENCKQSRKQ